MYEELGLSAEPFQNVTYYYPYSTEKYWNTYLKPEEVADNVKKKKAKKFKYIYKYDRNNLDLMFSNIDDTTQKWMQSSIILWQVKANSVLSMIGRNFLKPLRKNVMLAEQVTRKFPFQAGESSTVL